MRNSGGVVPWSPGCMGRVIVRVRPLPQYHHRPGAQWPEQWTERPACTGVGPPVAQLSGMFMHQTDTGTCSGDLVSTSLSVLPWALIAPENMGAAVSGCCLGLLSYHLAAAHRLTAFCTLVTVVPGVWGATIQAGVAVLGCPWAGKHPTVSSAAQSGWCHPDTLYSVARGVCHVKDQRLCVMRTSVVIHVRVSLRSLRMPNE